MIEIELLIPLAYFEIVRTLSTETAKTVHFVFFFFCLLLTYNSRTIGAMDLEKHHSTALDHEHVLLYKRSWFETLFDHPIS